VHHVLAVLVAEGNEATSEQKAPAHIIEHAYTENDLVIYTILATFSM